LGADEILGTSVEWGDRSGAPGSLQAAKVEVAGWEGEAKGRGQKQSADGSDNDAEGKREQELREVCMPGVEVRQRWNKRLFAIIFPVRMLSLWAVREHVTEEQYLLLMAVLPGLAETAFAEHGP